MLEKASEGNCSIAAIGGKAFWSVSINSRGGRYKANWAAEMAGRMLCRFEAASIASSIALAMGCSIPSSSQDTEDKAAEVAEVVAGGCCIAVSVCLGSAVGVPNGGGGAVSFSGASSSGKLATM